MKIYLVLFLVAAAIFTGCEDSDGIPVEKQTGVYIRFMPQRNTKAANDTDNLPEEYAINDLSIFLTEVGSNTVVNKYVHQSFSPVNDTAKLVALPLDPTTVARKDVYVIANCADITSLNAIQTLDDMKALQTPLATTTAGLATTQGLPMYGQSLNTNLSNTSVGNPALVPLIRACAKLQITLSFPDNSWIGTGNEFMIENAAPYTFYIKNNSFTFNASDLISYPQIAFNQIDVQNYQCIAYVYESSQAPALHVYTTINSTAKEYIVDSNFPLPVRNNFYDIQIQIFPPANANTKSNVLNCKVAIYSDNMLLDEYYTRMQSR
jgi:hypothetical protein